MSIPLGFERPAEFDYISTERKLKMLMGNKYEGLAAGSVVTIFLEQPPTAQQKAAIQATVETGSYGLTVVSNKTTIVANGTDTANVVCNTPLLAADVNVDFEVRFSGRIDGIEYVFGEWGDGAAAVESGTVTLTLATASAGTYEVIIKRQTGLHFGSVVIQATEA